MKNCLLLFLVLIANVNLQAQISWKTEELKGRVSYIKSTTYEFVEKFGEIERGNHNGSKGIFFDIKGYATKTFSFYNQDEGRSDTSSLKTYTYLFNERGQLREINEYDGYINLNPNPLNLEAKTRYKYAPDGQITEKNVYYRDGSLKQKYIYQEEDGSLIEKALNEEGEVMNFYDMEQVEEEISFKIVDIDGNGNWVKKLGFKNGKQFSEITRKIIYY